MINIDCTINDPVDVRCGGPEYLGFDFNVRKEDSKEIDTKKKNIRSTFKYLKKIYRG